MAKKFPKNANLRNKMALKMPISGHPGKKPIVVRLVLYQSKMFLARQSSYGLENGDIYFFPFLVNVIFQVP